ncbi:putative glutamine amidotransferase [Sphingomonas guangdongensis]|uniref:Putative glutamine amidotransferase n=1 Tax=Sphingomonas guangdongensis TaxID=1141890 RepID=A0A285QDF5_9SPHN|nr:gamma-glutamyl-gamma-aminobutyrate hydrolase family protein [Sphingomonas guangdongensis]SOB79514.1 putative glutamine amidotransferase [Sphingomonas guangdongensis]
MREGGRRPIVGIMCGNEVANRPVQAVATRFLDPLKRFCDASVLLVPAATDAVDIAATAAVLDGLLLTGGRSHVSPRHYGDHAAPEPETVDPERDAVALALAERMIAGGKPVFGICRGLQEINVLFGGSLSTIAAAPRHHRGSWDDDYDALFRHRHLVELTAGGVLAAASGRRRLRVSSVHQQGIARLGGGLRVEALSAADGLVEAVRAPACGANVLAVQWHPEWDVDRCAGSRGFFTAFGAALSHQTTVQ